MPGLLFLAAMGGLYAALYYLNHKTPIPAGCEVEEVSCHGCSISSCGKHPSQSYTLEVKQ